MLFPQLAETISQRHRTIRNNSRTTPRQEMLHELFLRDNPPVTTST